MVRLRVADLRGANIEAFIDSGTDEAKQHVAALLKMYPSMSIAEADALYRLFCTDPGYREMMARGLRLAGLPEGEVNSN